MMRIVCTIAIGLTLCFSGLAQDPFMPLFEGERTWCGVEGGWVPTPVTYWVEGDSTLSDGSLWHQLLMQYEGSPNPGLAGWFNEDVESGQVWMRWDLESDSLGTLWFDFGMEPGDSMIAPHCDWASMTCTAVEPFTWTDGTVSRRLTIQLLPDNPNFTEYWIEGIGSENGPMGPGAYLCIADWDPHAGCLAEDGGLRHDFEMDTTWLPAHPGCPDSLATNGVSDMAPFFGELVVRNGELVWSGAAGPASILLYDLMGRSFGSLDCSLPCAVPRTQGIFIAALPDGRRQKIRID